jgi:hypothetical protein
MALATRGRWPRRIPWQRRRAVGLPPLSGRTRAPQAVTPSTTTLLCAPDAGPTDGGFPATGQTTCSNIRHLLGGRCNASPAS